MIKQCALMALQKATNHALALDESMHEKLVPLNGRVLNMIIMPLKFSFYIQFFDGKMVFLDQYHGTIDTTIQSSPLGLIRLSLLPASKVRSLFNEQILISGDVELGQQVKQIFDQIDIDWEEHLAQFTGDVIAHQLGSFVRQGIAVKQRLSESMRVNLTGFLQEECRVFPSREEVNDFYNDIDDLSMQVERLSARINLLVKQQMPPHETH